MDEREDWSRRRRDQSPCSATATGSAGLAFLVVRNAFRRRND